MIQLHDALTYVQNRERILPAEAEEPVSEADARRQTMTYGILAAHNQGTSEQEMEISFDGLGVYDNTYVGILQSARASGLKQFPVPTVFTNCHNCLNAVGGTINEDVHRYAETACVKYGGIYVPPHQAVIHQYMREMVVKSGGMYLVSDSHTRYGTQGSVSIGEGGPELVKAILGRTYSLKYPKVIGVLLRGEPAPWVGPMDIALALIGKVFPGGFVKNAVLEFFGPGLKSLSMDMRNGIDTMTTESSCLSTIWQTDAQTEAYFAVHGRAQDYRRIEPGACAAYDRLIELDLDQVEPMIALPFHPSNAYPLADVIRNPDMAVEIVEKNAQKVFENNRNISFSMRSKIKDGKLTVDQGVVAGCCAGSFENIYTMSKMAEGFDRGIGIFGLNIYPASQPILYELNRVGAINTLLNYGVRVKTAFCGPCFGAGDTPANNDFSIRHSTRNFPNREGSNPAMNQVASVALMDARSIAATAFSGGVLTSAASCWKPIEVPAYHFNAQIYRNCVYEGTSKPQPEAELITGPDIKDWPEMPALTENLLLKVASVIRDEVTTTDELIPSGETASYRSNPEKIASFTLIRKDPLYVGRAKAVRDIEMARRQGNTEAVRDFYSVLPQAGIHAPIEELIQTTGIGSLLYCKRPGDGSAREYAASCQKVLGGLANLCIEYATKRYRSNCVNWGILPLTCPEAEISISTGEYVYLPGIRRAVQSGATEIPAIIISEDGQARSMTFCLNDVSEMEKQVLLAGSLINYYRDSGL